MHADPETRPSPEGLAEAFHLELLKTFKPGVPRPRRAAVQAAMIAIAIQMPSNDGLSSAGAPASIPIAA